MAASTSILLVNQHTVPVFTDVVNAFASDGSKCTLFTGHIEPGRAQLDRSITLVHSKSYNRKSTFTMLFSWSLFSLHYFFYLLFCRRPTAIVVVSNPPMAPFVTALVTALRRIPFHVVVYDLYPEALQQAGLSSSASLLFRWWQRNNRWTFGRAKGIITLSVSMKDAVARYVRSEAITVIPNWADTNYITPSDKATNPFIQEHHLTNKFVVLYSGNMGLTHDLESLLDAAGELSSDERIQFLLIGEGGKRKKLEAIKEQKKLNNVHFLPYQDAVNFPLAMAFPTEGGKRKKLEASAGDAFPPILAS